MVDPLPPPSEFQCDITDGANDLMNGLTSDVTFDIPDVDFDDPQWQFPFDPNDPIYDSIVPLTNEALTTRVVGGDGTYDAIMDGHLAHLKVEYEKGRITGAEYTKAYIAISANAMSSAVQFLLNRDLAFWQAQQAQVTALIATVQLAIAKYQLVESQFTALNSKARYALSKAQLMTQEVTYCTAKFQLDYVLPEEYEAARAQTLETRSDGSPVEGVIGKQKEYQDKQMEVADTQILLYNQQIESYQRDAEVRSGRLWIDAWITQKTIDEGLLPPEGFSNANLDSILEVIKVNNGFGPFVP